MDRTLGDRPNALDPAPVAHRPAAGSRVVTPPEQAASATSGFVAAADRTRALLSHPGKVAAILPAIGAVAIGSVLPLRNWPRPSLLVLLIVIGVAIIAAALRATVGSQYAGWVLQVDVGMGVVMVTATVAVCRGQHLNVSNLYLLLALFAGLCLSSRAALTYLGLAGAAYAVIIALGPSDVEEPPVLEWVSVFGTALVLGALTFGLMSVLRVAALQDTLTGLANRRSWDDRLEEEIQRSKRTGAPLSVAMIDLDGFKEVNDRDGHDAGDNLLQALAQTWIGAVRGGGDFLARLGGDEFGIVAPNSDETGINRLVERLHEASPDGAAWSSGAATWDRSERAQDLMRRADRIMYEAKQVRRFAGQSRSPA